MGVQAQTLAMIRRVTGGFLTQTCTIERESATTGAYGEPTHDREIVALDAPCRLIQIGLRTGSAEGDAGGAETLTVEYRLIVGRDVALAADMQVTVESLVYQVVRMETALTDESFHAATLYRRE